MTESTFIAREPLLDPKQRVLGYELVLQQPEGGMSSDEGLQAVARAAAECLIHEENGWLLGDQQIFLEASPALLESSDLDALSPAHTVLTLTMADLADAHDSVQALRARGFGIALREADTLAQANVLAQGAPLLACASRIELLADAPNLPARAAMLNAAVHGKARLVARHPKDWAQLGECAKLGLDAFVGTVYLTPQPGRTSKGMNAAQSNILQLMNLVRQEADVRELEGVLKRDAAISFKLFRYINSVGVGLGSPVQSLRHAVAMLGYGTLYRWLTLLLATASTLQYGEVLMQSAVIRGRFTELLGQGLLPRSEQENLFVVGMFSMLDRLLGIPMEQVLDQVQLSDAAASALLERGGIYGPFLALAEACEDASGNAADLADSLFISPPQANRAHLQALAWAQSLKM